MSSIRKHDFILMALVAIGVGIKGLLSSHKAYIDLQMPDACGIYCRMALNYGEMISNQSFDSYYFTKSFTSFLAWIILKIFSLPLVAINANYILESLNAVYLILSAIVWCFLCQKLKVSRVSSWVGFFGMFFTQLFLNITPHAQESPDNAAFFIGIAILYSYVSQSLKGLLACLFFTAFIQPQLKILILPLIYFFDVGRVGFNSGDKYQLHKARNYFRYSSLNLYNWFEENKKIYLYILMLFFVLMFSVLSYLSFFVVSPYFGTDNISVRLLPISILFQSFFLAYALFKLDIFLALHNAFQNLFTKQFVFRFICSLVVVSISSALIYFMARGEILSLNSTPSGRLTFAYTFIQQSISQPAIAIIVHLGFYGPILAMFCLLWGRIATEVKKLGSGIVIGVSLAIMLSNGIESRHLVAFLPWFTLFLCMSKSRYSLLLVLVLAVLQLAASRIYTSYRGDYNDFNDTFMMIWGPWISPGHYLDYFLVGIIAFVSIAFLLLYEKRFKSNLF